MLFVLILTAVIMAGQTDKQEQNRVPHKPKCKSAEGGIVYYRSKVWKYQDKLGQGRNTTNYPERKHGACAYKRYAARNWREVARRYKINYDRYLYQYAWWLWLPDKWQRIGACETGYGKKPGNWKWNSGTYQGAFGFAVSTWDQYKPSGAPSEAYLATPRQQYQTALNVVAGTGGLSGWGCRNA